MVTSRRGWQSIAPRTVLVAAMALMAVALTSCNLDSYVALGDSYTSGPVIPNSRTTPPAASGRIRTIPTSCP